MFDKFWQSRRYYLPGKAKLVLKASHTAPRCLPRRASPNTVSSTDEAERINALLSDGGEIFMPMHETFFAFRFSMLRDKFGTSWMIIHERPMPQHTEQAGEMRRQLNWGL
jgi:hypothetical protein